MHRDLKPTNILFKGDVLKICDMGQSRVLATGATVAETDSRGGTEGWRCPEELEAEERRQQMLGAGGAAPAPFQSRRSGDIHPCGSLMFYILTSGRHAYGVTYHEQQTNIRRGKPINLRQLAATDTSNCRDVADLFVRMTCLEPKARLGIEEVREHPAMWDAEAKLRKLCDWTKSWERGAPALQRRLEQHSAAVSRIVGGGGGGGGGWLAKLDEPVRQLLLAHGYYDGREPWELLRAIRNVAEHWFKPATAADEAALEVLTGCSAEETRRGQASADAAKLRAEACCRYFLGGDRFGDLLVVFHMPRASG